MPPLIRRTTSARNVFATFTSSDIMLHTRYVRAMLFGVVILCLGWRSRQKTREAQKLRERHLAHRQRFPLKCHRIYRTMLPMLRHCKIAGMPVAKGIGCSAARWDPYLKWYLDVYGSYCHLRKARRPNSFTG